MKFITIQYSLYIYKHYTQRILDQPISFWELDKYTLFHFFYHPHKCKVYSINSDILLSANKLLNQYQRIDYYIKNDKEKMKFLY